jgi:hypothetical protein
MIVVMRRMRWAPIITAFVATALVPGVAAGRVLAPPGHAGANQYVEVIPTSGGNAAPPGSVHGSGSPNAGPQALKALGSGPTGDTRLAKLGKDGQAAAALAASTAPAPAPAGTVSLGEVTGPDAGASSGGSASSGIAHLLSGSDTGGLGLLLPLLLATALLAALGIAVGRLRRRTGSTG